MDVALCALLVAGCGQQGRPAAGANGDVDPERARTLDRLAACLRDDGHAASVDEREDAVVVHGSGRDPDASGAAFDDCVEQLTAAGRIPDIRLTPERLDRLYDVQAELKACLEREGYDLPPMPSRQRYIDEGGRWFAFGELDTVDNDEWQRLNTVCPQK